jgi:hypothetical protein
MDVVKLRTREIKKIIKTQALKKWWVAEASGIHKTTFRRWLSGGIQNVESRRKLLR